MTRSVIPANTNDAKHTRKWWPELLSQAAAAQYLGVHRCSLSAAIDAGVFPIEPLAGVLGLSEERPRYRRRELDDWLLAGCPVPWKWEPTALQTMAEAVEERRRQLVALDHEISEKEQRCRELANLIERAERA